MMLQHELGVIRTLCHRADSVITDPEDQTREKFHIKEALKYCSKERDQRPKDASTKTIYQSKAW